MIYIESLDWDENTEEHIARHGVTIGEIKEAVDDIRYTRRSRSYLIALARTGSGRHLALILDNLGRGNWRVVTARPATQSERRLMNKKTTRRK